MKHRRGPTAKTHLPNLNMPFSPRKTSLCFLRPECLPPVTIATRLAVARAQQVSTSTFMVHRGQHPTRLRWLTPALWVEHPSVRELQAFQTVSLTRLLAYAHVSSARASRLWRSPGPSAVCPPSTSSTRSSSPSVLSAGLWIFLSLIKIDMNLFLAAMEEWH